MQTAEHAGTGEFQAPARLAPALADRAFGRSHTFQCLARTFIEYAAVIREGQCPCGPLEKQASQMILQHGDFAVIPWAASHSFRVPQP